MFIHSGGWLPPWPDGGGGIDAYVPLNSTAQAISSQYIYPWEDPRRVEDESNSDKSHHTDIRKRWDGLITQTVMNLKESVGLSETGETLLKGAYR